jgi:hypothetical protein
MKELICQYTHVLVSPDILHCVFLNASRGFQEQCFVGWHLVEYHAGDGRLATSGGTLVVVIECIKLLPTLTHQQQPRLALTLLLVHGEI